MPRWRRTRLCCGFSSVSLTLVLVAHISHTFNCNPNTTPFSQLPLSFPEYCAHFIARYFQQAIYNMAKAC
ncbi:BgtTE-56063 [Blumeria graminis f. sp. tritici]|uniref:BgtTE-56063 n=1 Tax=Blumeria graminis f. sp. tritici TaxID=62690 RepID=A0A9X9QD56_BLUGR|nr:BgtTE-56063 [Blumeria graminis f. sp. tritici]